MNINKNLEKFFETFDEESWQHELMSNFKKYKKLDSLDKMESQDQSLLFGLLLSEYKSLGIRIPKELEEVQVNESNADKEIKNLQERLEVAKDFLVDLDKDVTENNEIISKLNKTLEKYEKLGSPEEILIKFQQLKNEGVTKMKKKKSENTMKPLVDMTQEELTEELREYRELCGGLEELRAKMKETQDTNDQLESKLKEYEELGTPDEIESTANKSVRYIDSLESRIKEYEEFGTVSELNEVLEGALNHIETVEEEFENHKLEDSSSDESSEELEAYQKIGTPEEILEVVEDYAKMKVESESARLSRELKVSPEQVAKAIDTVGSVSKAESLLKELFDGKLKVKDERNNRTIVDIKSLNDAHENADGDENKMTRLQKICSTL